MSEREYFSFENFHPGSGIETETTRLRRDLIFRLARYIGWKEALKRTDSPLVSFNGYEIQQVFYQLLQVESRISSILDPNPETWEGDTGYGSTETYPRLRRFLQLGVRRSDTFII